MRLVALAWVAESSALETAAAVTMDLNLDDVGNICNLRSSWTGGIRRLEKPPLPAASLDCQSGLLVRTIGSPKLY